MTLTTDPSDPRLTHGVDETPVPQAKAYLVLPEADRRRQFVRPFRTTYIHTVCRYTTTIADSIAETYARNPGFYGSTYCVHCHMHRPVGADGEFIWVDLKGQVTDERVGS